MVKYIFLLTCLLITSGIASAEQCYHYRNQIYMKPYEGTYYLYFKVSDRSVKLRQMDSLQLDLAKKPLNCSKINPDKFRKFVVEKVTDQCLFEQDHSAQGELRVIYKVTNEGSETHYSVEELNEGSSVFSQTLINQRFILAPCKKEFKWFDF